MKKGEIYRGVVTDIIFPRKGVVKVADSTVFIDGTYPGQEVCFRITKKRSSKIEGKLIEVLKHSDLEIEPLCSCADFCGGCSFANLPYGIETGLKENHVKRLLEESFFNYYGENTVFADTYNGINKALSPTCYRNKMEYTFGDEIKNGPTTLGLHKKYSSHDIITVDDCTIVHEDFLKVLKLTLKYVKEKALPRYHRINHTGQMRHLLVRRAENTNEIMVAIVTTSSCTNDFSEYKDRILKLDLSAKLISVSHIINDSFADAIKADEIRLLYGREYIYEKLLGLTFKISIFSFFQTNSKMAEVLYSKVKDLAGNLENKVVLDLCCGTGSIAQILAKNAKHILGIELIKEAVEAAKENTKFNLLNNCSFIAGDVGEITKALNLIRQGKYSSSNIEFDTTTLQLLNDVDTIILDPPREGLRANAIEQILAFNPNTIVYVSCKPSSLAKDIISLLNSGYEVKKIELVDMFPRTQHVESVVLLSRAKEK